MVLFLVLSLPNVVYSNYNANVFLFAIITLNRNTVCTIYAFVKIICVHFWLENYTIRIMIQYVL